MENSGKSAFQQAVEQTPEVRNGYCIGIKAVKNLERPKIKINKPLLLDGSLDIDKSVKMLYPRSARWDYAISYEGRVCFLEVHPAYDGEIKKMIEKLNWLKDWLRTKAPLMASLPKYEIPYCWIPSGETGFLSMSLARKKIAVSGITYQKNLILK